MKSHRIRRIAVLAMPHFRQAAGAACKEKIPYGFPTGYWRNPTQKALQGCRRAFDSVCSSRFIATRRKFRTDCCGKRKTGCAPEPVMGCHVAATTGAHSAYGPLRPVAELPWPDPRGSPSGSGASSSGRRRQQARYHSRTSLPSPGCRPP